MARGANPAPATGDAELDRLHGELSEAHVIPTWVFAPAIIGAAPAAGYRPHLWKWRRMHELLMRAGELVTPERGAERRSIDHVNPDLVAHNATSHTLATAFQLVRPGETAPAHRHTAGAVRFAVRSRGGDVFTTVQGEKLVMERFDLVLTPKWMWHEHENRTGHDIIWLDALDYPFVNLMRASFFEPHAEDRRHARRPPGYTGRRIGPVRPAGWDPYPEEAPLVRYGWTETRAALEGLRGEAGSPHDGVILEYVNPFTSGPTLPTMSCRVQLLREDEHTGCHRETASTVYYAMQGRGFTIVDGVRFDWGEGDVLVIPPWAWHEHASTHGEAYLFSVTDKPILDSFGYYREEAGARQRVATSFPMGD